MNNLLRRYKENLFYAGIFALLFLAPVIAQYARIMGDSRHVFEWKEIFITWKIFAIYLVFFIIHNALTAPIFIYHRQKTRYALAVGALLVAFTLIQCATRPDRRPPHKDLPPMEMHPAPKAKGHHPPPPNSPPGPPAPPRVFGPTDLLGTIILFFMFGMNLGVKLYFKNEKYRKQMSLLEKQELEHQLEYLKYQINPHFFMNTLNNIHALVDINPEKAKSSIVVLSKMMRYVLYEGSNKASIPLERERDFISHYIELMRMRFTDKVTIRTDLPQESCEGEIPPLLLITFVENAFKHGISYQQDSFIDIRLHVDEEHITFTCRNSKAEKHNEEKGGVGLSNVRQRLDLLYGDRYAYTVSDTPDQYAMSLQLPLNI